MATATYTQFVDAVQALTITGVNRKHEEPPRNFNTADLPCSFVWFPSGDNSPLMFEGATGREFRRRALDLIVVYDSTALDADADFTATVTMMDNVEAALGSLSVGQSKPNWTIRSQLYNETAKRRYWAVVATIRGTG